GKPREFWIVMPDLVQPIPSDVPGEWLKSWRIITAGGAQHDVPPEQFLHFMQVDPGNPYWGMGPLLAAARTVDTDNEAQDTQKISMQNRGVTDGVFTHESILTPDQFEEARRQIRENFLAKNKRREPWVLGAGAKWNQMSLTPIEMDYIASRLANLRGIATAFGLDPWWLGDRSASTYNNVVEARKALYVEVVLPLLDDIKSTLNLKIAPMYGDITISYDTSKVAALREDFTSKVEQAKTLWAMGIPFDQINQRLEMGFEEFPGWDRGYLPLTLLPTGASPAPEEEPKKMMNKALNLDTEEQKAAHWKRIDRRRVAWWEVVSKKVKPLYEAEAKAIEKAIKGKTPDQLISAAGKAIKAGRPEWEKVLTAVLSALI
ncbi:MAG: phage portal protein, partial [Dehalococcoidia bacterium]|nr:phage portal protein [Dehalococcoidia bacterium]